MENIKRKRILTIIFLTIAIAFSGIVIIMSYLIAEVQSDYDEGINQLDSLIDTYRQEVGKYTDVFLSSFDELQVTARLTASALRSSGHELSPSAYGSGFIVKRSADGSGRPDGFPNIKYNDDMLFADNEWGPFYYKNSEGIFARIKDDYYYVEIIKNNTFDDLDDVIDPQNTLSDLAYANSCDYLLLGLAGDPDEPDDIPVYNATGEFSSCKSTKDFGLSAKEIERSQGNSFVVAVINDKPYLIQSLKKEETDTDIEATAVMVVNAYSVLKEAWQQTLSAIIIIMFICIALSIWILSVYRMVKSKALTFEESEQYSPAALRRRAAVCLLASAVVVYFGAVFNQSLEGMFLESQHGTKILDAFFHRVQDDTSGTDKLKALERKRIYANSTRIASLLSEFKELQNAEWLREASDIINADYIMLFDKNGDEVVTNSRYRGLSLGKDESSATSDFRRLLKGVRYIHHDNIKDEVTGLRKNLHGISVDLNSDAKSYGAMLVAYNPDEYGILDLTDYNYAAESLADPGTIIFGADPETGEIIYSSDAGLLGRKADDISAGAFPLRNKYLGFIDINGKEYYGRSKTFEDNLYYYFVEKSKMTAYSERYAFTCTALFLGIAIILLLLLLKGYNEENFRKYAVLEDPGDDELLKRFEQRYLKKQQKASADIFSLSNKDITPGARALSITGFLVFIYIVLIMLTLYRGRYDIGADSTLITYISRGDWERGFNTFAGAAILFLFCAVAVTLFMLRMISVVLVNLLSERSETISLLITNVLSYAVLIAAVFISLGYLGLNTRAILASAGLLGFALSLGAKDLVTDVLAGVTTIAEGTYQVGEVIEINGFRGEVARLGMRSTTLVGRGKNIKTFRNSSIGDVINYSRMNSWYPLTLTFSNKVHISDVEMILNEELPAVGAKYPEIISGPEYRGIDSVDSDRTTILILTECRQADYNAVQLNVNREVLHILKAHDIAAE